MVKREEITERELKLIEQLRHIGETLPYGEVNLQAFYQDKVIVHINIENRRESVKF